MFPVDFGVGDLFGEDGVLGPGDALDALGGERDLIDKFFLDMSLRLARLVPGVNPGLDVLGVFVGEDESLGGEPVAEAVAPCDELSLLRGRSGTVPRIGPILLAALCSRESHGANLR
jgi:hypothetical protein